MENKKAGTKKTSAPRKHAGRKGYTSGKKYLENPESGFGREWKEELPLSAENETPSGDKPQPGNGCPLAKKCGGCSLQNMTYSEQLSFKQVKEIRLLGRFGHVSEIIGMENPLHYRCKVQAAFAARGKQIISGVYQSSTHHLVPVDRCMIEDETADRIVVTIRKMMMRRKIRPYNEDNRTGFLRHVLIRKGYYSGQVMVVMVTGSRNFPDREDFIRELLEKHPVITTVVQNINNRYTSLVLGNENVVLYGQGWIEDSLMGKTFRISPASFYQVNPVMTEVLYGKAIGLLELTGTERVIDAYCGTGTIGILASDKAGQVLGIESNPDAVRDAKENAERNGVKNISFVRADAGEYMVQMAESGEKADALLMDPPRAGSDPAFLRSAVSLAPSRIVYVSCNPETLARDLGFLTRNGYTVRVIQPVDMFPWTSHVETVCLLVLRNPVTHINIDVDVEELVQDKRGQATYPQIKEYVLEQTGLKVSSLYISQVKRKCGLDVGDSYNKPKSEDAHVPQCPPEKEKAIMDALRHFGMI